MYFTILNIFFFHCRQTSISIFCHLHSKGMFLVGVHAMTRITELDQTPYNKSIPPNILYFKYLNVFFVFYRNLSFNGGPGSSAGIATGYGLDGPWIESRWVARFFAPVQTGPGANPASCTMGTGSSPGVKSGRGVMLTPYPF